MRDENLLPRRHPESAFRSIAEEGGLVVLPGRAEVKVMNPTGIKIFSLLDGKHSLEEIARTVTEEFEVSREQALQDIREFLEELARHGMLAEASTEGAPS